ncbi:MAG: hypothetical protein R2774_05160 [Saprospiraceae bacterium]
MLRNFSKLLGLVAIFMAVSVISCKQSTQDKVEDAAQEVKEEVQGAVDTVAVAMEQEKNDLGMKIKEASTNIENEIKVIDEKLAKATKQEKVALEAKKAKLTASLQELNNDVAKLGEDLKDGWNDFRDATAKKLEQVANDIKSN